MSLQLAQPELSRWENSISSLRVNELQSILQHFKINKLGRKQDLVNRVLQLLRTPVHQPEVIRLVSNMSNRPRPAPYTIPNPMAHRPYHASYGNPAPIYSGGATMGMYHTPKQVRNLKPVVLPFYDSIATIMEPVELPTIPSGCKTQQKLNVTFTVPSQYHPQLQYRDSTKSLPRHELQMRFFYLPPNYGLQEQADDFPPNCNVKIDDTMVILPNIIPTNKPNVEPKRPSRPVNITQNCQPLKDIATGKPPYRLNIDWTADRRAWAVGIYIVNRVTSDILKDRAQANDNCKQDAQITRQQIIRRMTIGDDDGIRMDQCKISLLCPLGKTRMAIPARCKDCTHLQCFDLDLFLRMNEKKPTWKCGICNSNAPYGKLIIDTYFQNILREVTDANEVELLTNGGYQKIHEEVLDISDNDDECVASDAGGDTVKRTTQKTSAPQEEDIITLDDDDDDDDDLQQGIAASRKQQKNTTPKKNKEIEIIDLGDDSPPRPSQSNEKDIAQLLQQTNPGSVQSTISASSISSPTSTPVALIPTSTTIQQIMSTSSTIQQVIPTSSTAQQTNWRDNSISSSSTQNFINRGPPNISFHSQYLNHQQQHAAYNMHWNTNIGTRNPSFQNALIGSNIPGFIPGAPIPNVFSGDQHFRQAAQFQQQPQTLAEILPHNGRSQANPPFQNQKYHRS